MQEMKFCQSCGMPLTDDILGTNADGSKNEDYCAYCYKDGAFTGDFTMEEMIAFCSQFVDEYNKNTQQSLTREAYEDVLRQYFPQLKRWKGDQERLLHAHNPQKEQFIREINNLHIADLPEVTNLMVLDGSYINVTYQVNGNMFRLLDDNKTYWGTQLKHPTKEDHCFGIACDEQHILVCEYDKGGVNPEIVAFIKR